MLKEVAVPEPMTGEPAPVARLLRSLLCQLTSALSDTSPRVSRIFSAFSNEFTLNLP